MKLTRKWFGLILAVVIAAVALRLPQLGLRPMHGDEAVNAIKFGELLQENSYRYDPTEYHGPTLNYFTIIAARLSSADRLTEVSEVALRIVPVVFGVLLVLMPLLLTDALGWPAVIIIMALTAVSPAFVFYSRYYIHETLLVCFSFGVIACGWRYAQSRTIKWALLCGMFLGLMHATKETCIIAFGSMILALLITVLMQRREGNVSNFVRPVKLRHMVAMFGVALVISVLFYSSFFTNPVGILDSFRAYPIYFGRAVQDNLHSHPWYYYLDILTWLEFFEKLTFNEDLIVVAAAFGFVVVMFKRYCAGFNHPLLRFIAFYTLIMLIIYSAIPYKTPWSMLSFLHGMILLAGVGLAVLLKMSTGWLEKTIFFAVIIFFFLTLPFQAYLGSFRYYTSPSNPYVYAHPTGDVIDISRRIEQVAQVHPNGRNMYIQVICPRGDYWPLPWYLRSFPKVGWWGGVDVAVPSAPVIIASADIEPALIKKLYELPPPGQRELYVPLFDEYMQLRPQVELRGYVKKSLWDSFRQNQ